ncbi:uncharacterized protein LOC116851870 isoform X2 [Odontomachus brunneus]|uniref:uncharacterized protein LOC116851870 isoform X2 n=1 Tax=Odontomachus brunneus TaxID=486640 RepID=UPI0013F23EB5|nr:uncharacterized protein LOC116851870 isoform X2 [Odontomachus brunneus]
MALVLLSERATQIHQTQHDNPPRSTGMLTSSLAHVKGRKARAEKYTEDGFTFNMDCHKYFSKKKNGETCEQ